MSFGAPAALWGLLSLLLLAIFSLWRQAAVRATVPSLHLWKKIPERNPPIRALRRPAWRWETLLQALALAAAVLALADPYLTADRPPPRRIAVVVDTSARLADRFERMRSELKALLDGPLADDDVSFVAADPSPRTVKDPALLRRIDAHVDLEPLIKTARQAAEHVVLFSDRPAGDVPARLFQGPSGNVGIVHFHAGDTELFARIANHGPPRRLALAGETVEAPSGEFAWTRKGDFSKEAEVGLELDVDDGFDLDDRASAVRLGRPETTVALAGLPMPLLQRALNAVPGVVIRQDGPADVAVGVDSEPGKGRFRVWLHAPPSPVVSEEAVRQESHPLVEDVRWEDVRAAGVGEAPSGAPLVSLGGRPFVALAGDTLHVAVSLDPAGWPQHPSWPIFWSNVIDFARRGRPGFIVLKTGEILRRPSGDVLTHSLEPVAVEGRMLRPSLLDARESDVEGQERPLPALPPARGRAARRTSLAGAFAALALAGVIGAWMMQRRSN
ncbi:MAG TPA: BatA domain-containing protein [Planctomycetota bacterium]|nr:BatA domain-containing protein [Planctomycetota bacterium]